VGGNSLIVSSGNSRIGGNHGQLTSDEVTTLVEVRLKCCFPVIVENCFSVARLSVLGWGGWGDPRDVDQRTFPCVKNKRECVVLGEIGLCKERFVFCRVEDEVVLGCMGLQGGESVRDRFVSVSVMRMSDDVLPHDISLTLTHRSPCKAKF